MLFHVPNAAKNQQKLAKVGKRYAIFISEGWVICYCFSFFFYIISATVAVRLLSYGLSGVVVIYVLYGNKMLYYSDDQEKL